MGAPVGVAVLVVIGGVLAGVVIRGWRRVRTRRQRPAAVGALPPVPLPQFNVVTVGLPGSGKTVLLASIYNRFQAPSGGRSYYLEAPRPQAVDLNLAFRGINDPSAPWPAGTSTGDFRQYYFAAAAPVRGGGFHRAFTIRYTEYAGELLIVNSQDGSRNQDLLNRDLAEAHAVMALLDGYDVLRVVGGDSDANGRLQHAISTFVDVLRHVTCSVNFVVTKWDLLQQTGRTDAELVVLVRDLLQSNDAFRWLVDRQDASFTIRLFPLSAVGPGFARVDGNGRVVKTTAAGTNPTGVTLPFSSVLPDLFDRAEAAARHLAGLHYRRQEAARAAHRRDELRHDVLVSALDQVSGLVPGAGLSVNVFRWITHVDPRLAQATGLPPAIAWLENVDGQGGAGIEAARLIIKEMRREIDAMEGALPDSVLKRVG